MRYRYVWLVIYYNHEEDPVYTAFDNSDSANRCFEYYKKVKDHCSLEEMPLYAGFTTNVERKDNGKEGSNLPIS